MKKEWGLIRIWLTPDKEEALTVRELAAHLNIASSSLYTRLKTYGPDHCLTYYPDYLPAKHRPKGWRHSKIKSIRRGTLLTAKMVDVRSARLFVLSLILRSKEDFAKKQCESSRAFLTNETGMLEWYLELMFSAETVVGYIERLQAFVREHSQIQSKLSENATDFSDLAN